MAIYHQDRRTESYDLGHGTRMGFRVVSLVGVIAFIALLGYFIFGPKMSVSENPPAGDTNTPVESMAAPAQEQKPTAQSAPPAAPGPTAQPQTQTPQQQPATP